MKLIRFEEPHESGGTCTVTMTEAQAIAWAKEMAKAENREYPSDEQALADFMTVFWAWRVPESASAALDVLYVTKLEAAFEALNHDLAPMTIPYPWVSNALLRAKTILHSPFTSKQPV